MLPQGAYSAWTGTAPSTTPDQGLTLTVDPGSAAGARGAYGPYATGRVPLASVAPSLGAANTYGVAPNTGAN